MGGLNLTSPCNCIHEVWDYSPVDDLFIYLFVSLSTWWWYKTFLSRVKLNFVAGGTVEVTLYTLCSTSILILCVFLLFLALLAVVSGAIVLHSPSSSQLNDGLQLFIDWYSCQSGRSADLMKDYWCWFLSLLLSVPMSPQAGRFFIVKEEKINKESDPIPQQHLHYFFPVKE